MAGLLSFQCRGGKYKGFLSIFILHTLRGGSKSGYEILKEIERKTNGSWAPSKGTIYPLLRQLQEEGFIKITKVEKRAKNVFMLTRKGKDFLEDLRRRKEEMRKRFTIFKNLFIDILEGEGREVERLLLEIGEKIYALMPKYKVEAVNILEKCLAELKSVASKNI